MPPRRAQSSVDPYGEDDTIVLPDGCIAEDVEIDFGDGNGQPHSAAEDATAGQRPLTYGLEGGYMATISSTAARQRTVSPSGGGSSDDRSGERTPLSADAVTESTKQRKEARRKSSLLSRMRKRKWWSFLPCFPSVPTIDERFGRKFTFGERLADRVSGAVGSWPFVCTQTLALFSWILFNVLFDGPDPYPFILLNLCLSFQAAYTGPIVMMSQNRQSDIDRDKAFDLHEKVDHIRLNQVWALWDQLQLQQKKLDTIQEGMDKIIDLVALQQAMQHDMQNKMQAASAAVAAQQQPPQPPPPESQPMKQEASQDAAFFSPPQSTRAVQLQAADHQPQPNGMPALPLSVSVGGACGCGDVSAPPTSTAAAGSNATTTASFLAPPVNTAGSSSSAAVSPVAQSGLSPPVHARSEDGPCTCLPPSMCDNCMSALERAEVTPAFLRRANPRFVPSAPSSFPTAEFVPASGHYSQPLDYRPGLHQQQVQQQHRRERNHAAAVSRASSTSPRRPGHSMAMAETHATPHAARRHLADRSPERITYIHPMPVSVAPPSATAPSARAAAPTASRVNSASDNGGGAGDIELAVAASAVAAAAPAAAPAEATPAPPNFHTTEP